MGWTVLNNNSEFDTDLSSWVLSGTLGVYVWQSPHYCRMTNKRDGNSSWMTQAVAGLVPLAERLKIETKLKLLGTPPGGFQYTWFNVYKTSAAPANRRIITYLYSTPGPGPTTQFGGFVFNDSGGSSSVSGAVHASLANVNLRMSVEWVPGDNKCYFVLHNLDTTTDLDTLEIDISLHKSDITFDLFGFRDDNNGISGQFDIDIDYARMERDEVVIAEGGEYLGTSGTIIDGNGELLGVGGAVLDGKMVIR